MTPVCRRRCRVLIALLATPLATTTCRAPRATQEPEARPAPFEDASSRGRSAAAPPSVTVPALQPVLNDPRLARVQTLVADHDWPGAARALEEAVLALGPDPRSPAEKCAWAYLTGRILSSAGRAHDAASAYDLASGTCELGAFARYRAAGAYLKAGEFAAAMDRAAAVDPASPVHDDAELVVASALAGLGRASEAVPRWRASLQKSPKSWIDVALPLASALLDNPAGDADAVEALVLAKRVIVEAPRIADSSGAEALRKRAASSLLGRRSDVARDLTLAERGQQARGWLDAGEASKAALLAKTLLDDPAITKEPALLCSASVTRAQALGRTKAGAGTAWDDAISRCEHDPMLVTALYSGAKAAGGKQPDVARTRYAKVEELFPAHRLADDARFQGALLALSQGDEATFTQMMLSLPDVYPAGDQRAEALFRVALLRMTRRDWAGASPLLDRIIELTPDDQHWATAGRAEYFRARAAAEAGRTDEARGRYAKVLERHPFAFYMTQAYARLSEADPSLATSALASAFGREEDAAFVTTPHAELSSPAFATARALLEVTDTELARRELASAGATRDDVDPEVLWVVARLYDQAGAPEVGHAFARQRLRDYLSHYPVGAWKTKWQIAYPRAFDDLVTQGAATNGIPSALAWAIMREESDFVADAKSSSNAYGLMQLILPTARGVARGTGLPSDEAGLVQPRVNVALGTRLLGQLRRSFAENPTLAIAAYNGGGGAVSRWLAARGDEAFDLWVEEIPWEETRGYEKRVLSSQAAYAYLYDPTALDEVLRSPRLARGAGVRAEKAHPDESVAR